MLTIQFANGRAHLHPLNYNPMASGGGHNSANQSRAGLDSNSY